MRSVLIVCSLILLLSACANENSGTDCPTTPSAIFSDQLERIENHDFLLSGTDGLEVASFDNGLFLEIYQSGCDSLRQEFRFHPFQVPETDSPAAWLGEAQEQFRFLGSLGPDYAPFAQWADALAPWADEFRLAQPMEVQSGFWMQIDKIDSFDGPTLIVVLANFEL